MGDLTSDIVREIECFNSGCLRRCRMNFSPPLRKVTLRSTARNEMMVETVESEFVRVGHEYFQVVSSCSFFAGFLLLCF